MKLLKKSSEKAKDTTQNNKLVKFKGKYPTMTESEYEEFRSKLKTYYEEFHADAKIKALAEEVASSGDPKLIEIVFDSVENYDVRARMTQAIISCFKSNWFKKIDYAKAVDSCAIKIIFKLKAYDGYDELVKLYPAKKLLAKLREFIFRGIYDDLCRYDKYQGQGMLSNYGGESTGKFRYYHHKRRDRVLSDVLVPFEKMSLWCDLVSQADWELIAKFTSAFGFLLSPDDLKKLSKAIADTNNAAIIKRYTVYFGEVPEDEHKNEYGLPIDINTLVRAFIKNENSLKKINEFINLNYLEPVDFNVVYDEISKKDNLNFGDYWLPSVELPSDCCSSDLYNKFDELKKKFEMIKKNQEDELKREKNEEERKRREGIKENMDGVITEIAKRNKENKGVFARIKDKVTPTTRKR